MHIEIANTWNKYLDQFQNNTKDIYFTEEYCKSFILNNRESVCIICNDSSNILLMPINIGKIYDYFDFETPYGYGGPISNTNNQEWITQALSEIKVYLSYNNFIAGFIRFHPLLNNVRYCMTFCKTVFDRNTIAIDTSLSIEQIWNTQLSSKNRNTIRKAEKSNLRFEADYDYKHIDEFKDLYNETMSRLNADDFYIFEDNYYKNYINLIKNNGFLGLIYNNSEIISGALFMYSSPYGHYHLAGSNRNYTNLGSNNFLLWNAALELKKNNVSFFHLGGGTDGQEDNSLFKFKKSFSSDLYQFSFGKIILNEEVYNKLCLDWEEKNTDKKVIYQNYFLKYRY